MHSKRVAVLTPLYRLPLLPEEEISLNHLRKFLGNYERVLILPKKLKIPPHLFPDFKKERFNTQFFSGIESYNRLMLSDAFYRRFKDYEYILIYQLDCLVFSNNLLSWCDKEWDYVGAPWFHGNRDDTSKGFSGVGNGGLSLRKVQSFRDVLNSKKLLLDPEVLALGNRRFQRIPLLGSGFRFLMKQAYRAGLKNNIRWYLKKFDQNEDSFWAYYASKFVDEFVIPTSEEALKFSFECAPEFCLSTTDGVLPFGCHAWKKWDENFWKPYLL